MRVVVALSGGVDSAVVAARVAAAGHEVLGVHLALHKNAGTDSVVARGCASPTDVEDARKVAAQLNIGFAVWDFSQQFQREILTDFLDEYRAGRTPNPCLRCNERIKFAALLDRAVEQGYDKVATGHYAKLVPTPPGVALHRAADMRKDQSYVLARLNQQQLQRCWFPLAEDEKTDVRDEAQRLGLGVASKPDSTDICFIPDGNTQAFLTKELGQAPGRIVTADGTQLGTHDGTHNYTVGQRKGLSLRVPAADGKPRYVLRLDPVARDVVVGSKDDLAVTELRADRISWPQSPVAAAWQGLVQFRAHSTPVPAQVRYQDGQMLAELAQPALGIAPGQTLVAYDGDRVVCSGIISAAS
ncbi:MAG: tRNA 2-thiouridine(34) synthase MnmA [Arachnia propionica]|nr:MAG: tRNA 2-thiouridine(34) synthase MnmA [Arachnia propionica]